MKTHHNLKAVLNRDFAIRFGMNQAARSHTAGANFCLGGVTSFKIRALFTLRARKTSIYERVYNRIPFIRL